MSLVVRWRIPEAACRDKYAGFRPVVFNWGWFLPPRWHWAGCGEVFSVTTTGKALRLITWLTEYRTGEPLPCPLPKKKDGMWHVTSTKGEKHPCSKVTMYNPGGDTWCYCWIWRLKQVAENKVYFKKYCGAEVLKFCCTLELPGERLKDLMPRLHHRPTKSKFLGAGLRN